MKFNGGEHSESACKVVQRETAANFCHKCVERGDKNIPVVHKPMILNSCTQILMNSLTENNSTCTYRRTLEFTVRIHKDDTRIPCIHVSTVTTNRYKPVIPTDTLK